MNNLYIVDRIEGEYVVIETPDENMINVDKILIQDGVKTGDCLVKLGETYKIDIEQTERRKERIHNLMKGMWAD